jgi:hypothetical protein
MPFNYQTLKNITGSAVVDLTITDSDIAARSIPTADLNNGAITAAKLSAGAVDLTGTKVTGVMPIAKGGTALSAVGSANTVLRVNAAGNAFEYSTAGFSGMQVFTSSGTWNRPSGVRFIRVKVQGSGGGASGHGESGGAGGYAERIIDVTGTASVSVTIDGGGGGTWYSGAGGNAGGTSFGGFCSASAGHGANRQNQHSGGVSGNGSGGNLNIHQGSGFSHHARSAQSCADSYFGGGAPSSHPQGGNFAHNHQSHTSPGTGGAGAHFHGHRGSDGRPGIVVVTNYY